MVNERDANSTSSAPVTQRLPAQTHPSDQHATRLEPKIAPKPTPQVEFGKASPLRNPHKQSHIFNTNKQRTEHHRSRPVAVPQGGQNARPNPTNPPFRPPSLSTSSAPRTSQDAGPTTRDVFFLPGQRKQMVQQANPNATIGADFFEIARPTQPAPRTIQPAPKQMFSSLGPRTTFQPFVPPSRTTIDLTKDDDGFDPDAASRDDRFGAADPLSYIDPSQASDNIKALLDGAFDDEDDKPKTRLRNRARKKAKKAEDKASSLAAKLAALDVKEDDKGGIKNESEQLTEAEDEEDDGTVEGLAVKLLPHQVDGVSWMIDKEIGERKKNGVLPKGGILADDMGLGKTIQSITLILTNPRPPLDAKVPEGSKMKLPGKEIGKGTLVVAPLALIKQWEAEIKTRVLPSHSLKVLVHHGASRTKSFLELKKYDVVITTYQILTSEHAGSSDHAEGLKVGCFGIQWYRVILDEAHSIKNRNAKSTQACYALNSCYRWCLTGTPMQNNLDELQSLIHFLRIKPYNELSHWKNHITGPMKNGKGHYAIRRVQYFLKAFMKRRTKDILKQEGALNFGGKTQESGKKSEGMKIVERHVETVVCELDKSERQFYDRLAERANDRLHDMMSGEKADYIGALVLLLRLRQACNHPQLIESAMRKDKDALATAGLGGSQSPTKGGAAEIDDLADMFGGLDMASKTCDVCQVKLSSMDVSDGRLRCPDCEEDLKRQKSRDKHRRKHRTDRGRTDVKPSNASTKMRNRKVVIDSDDEDDEGEGESLVDDPYHGMSHQGHAGGTDDEDAEGGGRDLGTEDSDTDSNSSDDEEMTSYRRKREATDPTSVDSSSSSDDEDLPANLISSTKIRHLVRLLRAESSTHKFIVFSQFTSMLDLIAPFLTAATIPFVRYDGSMPNPLREASLQSLRTDPSTRVLLCSLKCGSLGLNLTAASRVVIVEPFWNPFVEEQAIDRVHRLNQTVDVKVYKLTVANSVEERILELQGKKRELAKAAIEGGKAVAKLSMKDLLGLFGGGVGAGMDAVEDDERERREVEELTARRGLLDRGTIAGGGGRTEQQRNSDPRKRVVQRGPRMSNEDPVYGRR